MQTETVIATGTDATTGLRLCVFAEDYNRNGQRVYRVCKETAPVRFGMFSVSAANVELDG